MAHISEGAKTLRIEKKLVDNIDNLSELTDGFSDVLLIRLPALANLADFEQPLQSVSSAVALAASKLNKSAVLIVVGEIIDLISVQSALPPDLRYQLWIAIKKVQPASFDSKHLPNAHFGALVCTRYPQSLKHIKTRIKYTYCPTCDKTTKDYGGKKHTYHSDGTLISDVWRDITCDLSGDISDLTARFADLFGLEPYSTLLVLDCSRIQNQRQPAMPFTGLQEANAFPDAQGNRIICGDCIEELRRLPSNSVDFAFADPPYNLRKKYAGYGDDREIQGYFQWCDSWIEEVARVLKPGRTFALLNIPLWSVRHFAFAQKLLQFQNWIVWDALSFPVRLIMPAHYTVLCFSKGEPRDLPGLVNQADMTKPSSAAYNFDSLRPLAEGFCLRSACVDKRMRLKVNDKESLTDLWSDIHRLKHNSRRVDHPCQLPPQLMYRLISIFTKENELVLDCFNGAGTTTLSAQQIRRRYFGIENSLDYCVVARQRHNEISQGIDPFRKEERALTAKNSPVARLPKQKYKVTKKTLQLDVKRIAQQIGHMPTRNEVVEMSNYPITYFDSYFVSWGEVTAAARTNGMTEKRDANSSVEYSETQVHQLRLLDRSSKPHRKRKPKQK
jgi:site-specific DNA-methyltransferase (adenine-specific)